MAVYACSVLSPVRLRGPISFSGSLVWLPAGIVATAAFRGTGLPVEPQAWLTLVITAPCGLPLALACRRLRLRGYPRAA